MKSNSTHLIEQIVTNKMASLRNLSVNQIGCHTCHACTACKGYCRS